jgi:hypothetical protein
MLSKELPVVRDDTCDDQEADEAEEGVVSVHGLDGEAEDPDDDGTDGCPFAHVPQTNRHADLERAYCNRKQGEP